MKTLNHVSKDTIAVICTGNTCRSPVTARILANRLTGEGLHVVSAGTQAFSGQPAAEEALTVLRARGYPLLNHRAQVLQELDWDRVGLVIALAGSHVPQMKSFLAEHGYTSLPVWTLGQLAERTIEALGGDVLDPFGGSVEQYEAMTERVEAMVDAAVEPIRQLMKGEAPLTKAAVFQHIAVACDHGGFVLKETVLHVLDELGIRWEDLGTHSEESVDYPPLAEIVGERVRAEEVEAGILICGTGIGMAIAANKVPGVRAANCVLPDEARLCREHNDANILTLGARTLEEERVPELVRLFCQTPFEGGRHARRVSQIHAIETRYMKEGDVR